MTRVTVAVIACVFLFLGLLLACNQAPPGQDAKHSTGGGVDGPGDDNGGDVTLSPVEIIKDPLATTVLGYMATPRMIAESGASGTNVAYESGQPGQVTRFDVADQRHCWQATARGIAEDDVGYIESGLKAIDYAFAHQEAAGNFGESRWFETIGFLESAVRSYALIKDSKYRDDYLPEIEQHLDGMKAATGWLVATKDEEFSTDWEHAPDYLNAVAGTAVAFGLMGLIAENGDWTQRGKEFIEIILSNQWENGVFPEAGGYDSSYQAVTLWHLMIYLIYSRDEELNGRLQPALELGWEWELSRITADGEVITDGNARTGPDGEVWRGKRKEVNYPEVLMALVYWSYVSDDEQVRTLADKVYDFALELYRQGRG
ncbi:MAG: hypothetical protein ABIJ00_15180 [Candidatus Eisenbacteria bacterium]